MTTGTRTVPTVNPGASPREQYDIKALKPVAGVTGPAILCLGFHFFHLYNGYNNRKQLPPAVSMTT